MASKNEVKLVLETAQPFSKMSLEDLSQLNAEITRLRQTVILYQEKINSHISELENRESISRKIRTMTPDERKHLQQVLKAEGVASQEGVNG